ncbi:MAG TPA: carboxypeptidase-like regulatory domain-containing protein, partial [Chitinophagaceae bacterium]|nr:carboxypeptidase-like regulatory domain-containing protein [Chitinophagaceae bacterium]
MSCRKLLMAPVLCTVLMLLSLISFSQGKVITGKVTDAKDGSGIGGATVMVKGTTNATQSKLDGTFTLDVTSGGNTLVFSAIGYTTQEISIEGKSTVDVSMGINTASLGEVVVIGY